jgi:mycofactocin precursor peptide peptidase
MRRATPRIADTATAMGDLGTYVWPQLWRAAPRPLLIVPIGSCEQHGPHLPLDTDTRIAVALASGLVDSFDSDGDGDVAGPTMLVAPALTISASGEHGAFPGTLSLGAEVFEQVVVELVRSADWSGGVVLVNGHGGNAIAVQRAVATLALEGRKVLSWWPRDPGGDAHAGITETSVMLAIAPDLVRMADAVAGRTEPLRDLAPQLRSQGVMAVSPNGVLGDPTGSTAGHGRAVLTRWRIDLVAAVDEWRV